MSTVTKRNQSNRSLVNDLWNDPFQQLENRMNQFFRPMLDSKSSEFGLGNYPVDVEEDEESIIIDAELPGFTKDEINVNVENGVLTIQGERLAKDSSGKNKHLNERRFTRVLRSFSLPSSVDGSDVDARLDHGVLQIRLKKTEEAKPRRIEIK